MLPEMLQGSSPPGVEPGADCHFITITPEHHLAERSPGAGLGLEISFDEEKKGGGRD